MGGTASHIHECTELVLVVEGYLTVGDARRAREVCRRWHCIAEERAFTHDRLSAELAWVAECLCIDCTMHVFTPREVAAVLVGEVEVFRWYHLHDRSLLLCNRFLENCEDYGYHKEAVDLFWAFGVSKVEYHVAAITIVSPYEYRGCLRFFREK